MGFDCFIKIVYVFSSSLFSIFSFNSDHRFAVALCLSPWRRWEEREKKGRKRNWSSSSFQINVCDTVTLCALFFSPKGPSISYLNRESSTWQPTHWLQILTVITKRVTFRSGKHPHPLCGFLLTAVQLTRSITLDRGMMCEGRKRGVFFHRSCGGPADAWWEKLYIKFLDMFVLISFSWLIGAKECSFSLFFLFHLWWLYSITHSHAWPCLQSTAFLL